jgi:hypothetical protein
MSQHLPLEILISELIADVDLHGQERDPFGVGDRFTLTPGSPLV